MVLPRPFLTPRKPPQAADPSSKRSRAKAKALARHLPSDLHEALAEHLQEPLDYECLEEEMETAWATRMDEEEAIAMEFLGEPYAAATQNPARNTGGEGVEAGAAAPGQTEGNPHSTLGDHLSPTLLDKEGGVWGPCGARG